MLLALAMLAQLPGKPLDPVPFERVRLADGFFAPRIETNRKATIEACLAKCEETGRIRNFAIAGGLEEGKHEGFLYNDSDVYKVLEGVAYSLKAHPDPALEARADAIIAKIAAAQREDGYLDTYFQLVEPAKRWKNIRHGHELYCAGHLIEAAVAYEAATGKTKLLEVATRVAACIDKEFGWGKHQEPTGHPELELALMKLHRRTAEKRWLDLARFFLDVRGKKDRGTELFGEYAQDHLPLREQKEVVGHAVRAMYLYCGAADVAAATGDRLLFATLEANWADLVLSKMYVTGGIGSSGSNEGFTKPFDLPNDSAYCETCASIGLALWSHRMFLLTRDPNYADILEREVYNNVPSGVSLSGDRFFYDNPLASRGDSERVPWFDCSCCPTNLVRFLPAMGERLYATDERDLYVILYAASEADLVIGGTKVRVRQETDYPQSGKVTIRVDPEEPVRFRLHWRVPGWCTEPAIDQPGGEREWKRGDSVSADFKMPPRRVRADPRVEADRGRVALARGPVIYCLEGFDHGGRARDLALPPDAKLELAGDEKIRAKGQRAVAADPFHRSAEPAELTAIPYCLWANRGKGEMVVWIPEDTDIAEIAGAGLRELQNGALLGASHCWRGDSILALNDGKIPSSSGDESIPRLTFWDHRGTEEWLEIDYRDGRELHAVGVYWFDDGKRGGNCRVPASARLLARDGDAWREAGPVGLVKDAWNRVDVEEISASALRLEVRLQEGFSAGVLEWRIE